MSYRCVYFLLGSDIEMKIRPAIELSKPYSSPMLSYQSFETQEQIDDCSASKNSNFMFLQFHNPAVNTVLQSANMISAISSRHPDGLIICVLNL